MWTLQIVTHNSETMAAFEVLIPQDLIGCFCIYWSLQNKSLKNSQRLLLSIPEMSIIYSYEDYFLFPSGFSSAHCFPYFQTWPTFGLPILPIAAQSPLPCFPGTAVAPCKLNSFNRMRWSRQGCWVSLKRPHRSLHHFGFMWSGLYFRSLNRFPTPSPQPEHNHTNQTWVNRWFINS